MTSTNAKNIALRAGKTIMLPLAVYLIFLLLLPGGFGSWNTVYVCLIQSVVPTLIGWGMCMNMMAGAFDFSGGAVVSLSAMVGAYASWNWGIPGLVITCVVMALLLELVTGTIFTLLRIPSIVVTIGTLLVFESITQLYHGGNNAPLAEGTGLLGKSPYIFVVCLVSGLIFHMIYEHTRFGYQVKCVGNNARVAKNIGIDARKVKFLCFLVGGIFMGIAAVAQVSYGGLASAKTNMATLELTFTPLMGVVLGIQLSQICGMAMGIFVGEFTINLITSGLIGMGLSGNYQKIVTGVALLLVLVAVSARSKMMKRKHYNDLVKAAQSPSPSA